MRRLLSFSFIFVILMGLVGFAYAGGYGSNMMGNGNAMGQNGSYDHMGSYRPMRRNEGMSMMGRYMGNGYTKTIDKNVLNKFFKTPLRGVIVNKVANTIEYTGANVDILVVASPSEKAMYAFGIYGLVNPTIMIHKGAMVKFVFVNADDDMYHGIMITPAEPPYPYMVMMSSPIAFQGSFIRPLAPESKGKYVEAESQFRASGPGTYYYICQVPGHARKGMYGKFIVLDK